MFSPLDQWILAAVFATIISVAAWRIRSLSPSGTIAAILLGTSIVGTGGWWAGGILVTFFVTSSALSRLTRNQEPQARGSRRDWVQVLANGWGLLLGCLLWAITGWEPWFFFGVGSVAAATADTWGSEVGPTSTSAPRLVTNLRLVAPGTSGAVSLRGTFASLVGAVLIGLLTALASSSSALSVNHLVVFAGVSLAGFAGGMVDSLLGATVQERRWCGSCAKETEANPHRCGTPTSVNGGTPGINNDVVNTVCVLTGALIGMVSSIL